ncbi:hypothetical protein [Streptomyces syringium]|uniref:hypothetical protein n=1 Tax=Streptomyces syringium TaxID=76729 RepID=UPI003441B784
MADEQLVDDTRRTRLREQDEERRRRKVTADLRLQQQERQAQDEAHPAGEPQYAQLPRPSYTGIR